MKNFYRITGYDPKHNFNFVLESRGMFEKKWQFSAFLIQHGLKIIDIIDIFDTENLLEDKKHLFYF